MTRKETRKENSESLKGKTPERYVVPESEIRRLVGSLDIHRLSIVAARFQIVADLTSGAFEERIDRLDQSALMLIKRIADEDNSARYRRLMKAIIAGVGQGRHGINAAHLTAGRVVELAFRCTSEYFSALHSYRRSLRLRLIDRTGHAAHAGRRSRDW